MAKGAPRKQYKAEDHQKAYEVYFLSRNFSDVQRQMGLSYETVLKWEKANYICPFGCNWHGWDEKIEDQMRVIAAKERAAPDPVSQAAAVELALDDKQELVRMPPVEEVKYAITQVTTRHERLYQWKFLYAKLTAELNGLTVDYTSLNGDVVDPKKRAQIDEQYKKGLRANNLSETIRMLGFVEDRIEKLERELSTEGQITVTPTGSKAEPPRRMDQPELTALPEHMSIEEVRNLARLAGTMTPGAVKTVIDVMQPR